MSALSAGYGSYRKVDVETASQGKLIVMLFNGAVQRAEEARRQLDKRNYQAVHNNLIHAQDIIAELRGALNMKAGDVAQNLDRIYEYFQHLLIRANVAKDGAPIDNCVELLTAMRDTWQELFDKLAKENEKTTPPGLNQHGDSVMNLQG